MYDNFYYTTIFETKTIILMEAFNEGRYGECIVMAYNYISDESWEPFLTALGRNEYTKKVRISETQKIHDFVIRVVIALKNMMCIGLKKMDKEGSTPELK